MASYDSDGWESEDEPEETKTEEVSSSPEEIEEEHGMAPSPFVPHPEEANSPFAVSSLASPSTRAERAAERRRMFYGALSHYNPASLPPDSYPFPNTILERILLFLEPDKKTLLAASQVQTNWRFMSNYLPVWSHFHWVTLNKRRTEAHFQRTKTRTSPPLPRDTFIGIEQARRSAVKARPMGRAWRFHVQDTLFYAFLVLFSCLLSFVIVYAAKIDTDMKCGALCLIGAAIAFCRLILVEKFVLNKKGRIPRLSKIFAFEDFGWRRNILRMGFVLTIFIGTAICALTTHRLWRAESIKNAGYAVLSAETAQLPCTQQPREVLPYVRLAKPLSSWKFNTSIPRQGGYAVHGHYYYRETLPDIRPSACGYVTGNTIQVDVLVRLSQEEFSEAEKGTNVFGHLPTTEFRGMAHTVFWNLADGDTIGGMRLSKALHPGQTVQIIHPYRPANIPQDAENRYKRHIGYLMAVMLTPVGIFLLLSALSFVPEDMTECALKTTALLVFAVMNPLMLAAWGIVCLVDEKPWLMCNNDGGSTMLGIGFGIPLLFFAFCCGKKRRRR